MTAAHPAPPPPGSTGGTLAALARAEELTSEAEFLKSHQGSFTLRVAVPQEYGHGVSLTVDYSAKLRDVKSQLVPFLSGLKENKMQLKHPQHGFMKDSLSLAHYNVDGTVEVLLVPKVRGRR